MCEERERLIGYVYDECDPAERQAIEAHLESCHTCRREIAGLRSVRQDLLTWDVPAHESIWRPAAPPRVESPWKRIPAWAMAAAAAAILAVGAAGGATTYALFPRPAMTTAQVATPAVAAVPATHGADELAVLEQRVLAKARAEMESRLEAVSTRAPRPAASPATVSSDDVMRELTALRSRQDQLSRTLWTIANETDGLKRKQNGLQSNLQTMVSLQQDRFESQGSVGGR
jgi:anti-sigma factor RsiW